MSLTIISIQACDHLLPLREPLVTSRHAYNSLASVFVLVTLSDGSEGLGEARECTQITGETQKSILTAITDHIAPALIGRDAEDLEEVHTAMRMAIVNNSAARSAVDIALHDAIGHARGLSITKLLGGGDTRPVPSSRAISVGRTPDMIEEARSAVAVGFRTLKIKTGIDAAAELAAIVEIRAEVGPDILLKLDANQAWSLSEATRFLDWVETANIQMVEQPLPAWDLAGSAELRRRTPIPIMLDEGVHSPEGAYLALEAGACDYINIKLLKTGGLYPALKLIAVAESAGVACQIGTLDSSVGSAAAVHLVRSRRSLRFAEINGPSRLVKDVAQGFVLTDGMANVQDGPGLGICADHDSLGFVRSIN